MRLRLNLSRKKCVDICVAAVNQKNRIETLTNQSVHKFPLNNELNANYNYFLGLKFNGFRKRSHRECFFFGWRAYGDNIGYAVSI